MYDETYDWYTVRIGYIYLHLFCYRLYRRLSLCTAAAVCYTSYNTQSGKDCALQHQSQHLLVALLLVNHQQFSLRYSLWLVRLLVNHQHFSLRYSLWVVRQTHVRTDLGPAYSYTMLLTRLVFPRRMGSLTVCSLLSLLLLLYIILFESTAPWVEIEGMLLKAFVCWIVDSTA